VLKLNKWLTIGLSIAIAAFLSANAILLFSEKSIIPKTIYVHNFERVSTGSFEEQLPKESLIAPEQITTVYVKDENTVAGWLVKEGDVVQTGAELAQLNTSTADEQRAIWEAEREALERQLTEINSTISNLESERKQAKSDNSSDANQSDSITGGTDDQPIEVDINVDVEVDVQQDGAFAQAISQAEQELAEVNRQLLVVDAQLAQEGTKAIISPVEGIVSDIREDNGQLAIDLYSSVKVIVTYATDEEWQEIQANDRVRIQADGLDASVEGVVLSVSQVPATESDWLKAFQSLDPKEQSNPLAYYEVRVQPNEPIETLPFGNNTNSIILVNEAKDAVSVKTMWLYDRFEENATVHVVSANGLAVKTPVTIAFDWKSKSILSGGVKAGSVIVYEPEISDYRYAPAIFFPMPMDIPTKDSVKDAGWKFYLKHLIF
jgi:HlyD family secretion protein